MPWNHSSHWWAWGNKRPYPLIKPSADYAKNLRNRTHGLGPEKEYRAQQRIALRKTQNLAGDCDAASTEGQASENEDSHATEFNIAIANFDAEHYGPDYLKLKPGYIIKFIKEDEKWHFGERVDSVTMSVTFAQGWYPPVFVEPIHPPSDLKIAMQNSAHVKPGQGYLIFQPGTVIKYIKDSKEGLHFGVLFDKDAMDAQAGWYSPHHVVPYKQKRSILVDEGRGSVSPENHAEDRQGGNVILEILEVDFYDWFDKKKSAQGEGCKPLTREAKEDHINRKAREQREDQIYQAALHHKSLCYKCDQWTYVGHGECQNPQCSRLRRCQTCGCFTYVGHGKCRNPQCRPLRRCHTCDAFTYVGHGECRNPQCGRTG